MFILSRILLSVQFEKLYEKNVLEIMEVCFYDGIITIISGKKLTRVRAICNENTA